MSKTEGTPELYVNLKSGKKAIILYKNDGAIVVKYLVTKHKVEYRTSYFVKHFNLLT